MEEYPKFFVNCDKWLQQSKNFQYDALTTLKVFQNFANGMNSTRIVYLDSTKELTASCTPELHGQFALTRVGNRRSKFSKIALAYEYGF